MSNTTAGWMKWMVLAALIAGTAFTINACTIEDVLQVNTPMDAQKSEGLPKRLSLRESKQAFTNYVDSTASAIREWEDGISQQQQIAGVLGNAFSGWIEQGLPSLSAAAPFIGPLLPALTLLTGIAIRKPGDTSKDVLRKEKEDSFNAGVEKGRELTASA